MGFHVKYSLNPWSIFFSPCKGLVQRFCNFIWNFLNVLWIVYSLLEKPPFPNPSEVYIKIFLCTVKINVRCKQSAVHIKCYDICNDYLQNQTRKKWLKSFIYLFWLWVICSELVWRIDSLLRNLLGIFLERVISENNA